MKGRAVAIRCLHLAAATLPLLGAPARAQEPLAPSLRAVLDAHLCDIRERLQRIHRSTDSNLYARHLIIEPAGRPDAYVQCRFAAGDTRMRCEAASGYYPVQDGPRRPHPGDAEALAALGFEPRPEDNDGLDLDLARPPDLGRVAVLMLRALHDGYGVRVPTPLVVTAPLAREPGLPQPGCSPVS